jgi:hypothetical protein
MSIDPRYVLAPSLQEYFVDKDTGLPLAGGIVTFYQDNSRTVLQPVYELTGSPPNYSFTALPNPLTLSGVGTIQDSSGNDVLPYFFPFDSDGNPSLYYITVMSAGAVPQFVREGWPAASFGGGGGGGGSAISTDNNLIINGTFFQSVSTANPITTTSTFLAPGPSDGLVYPDIYLIKNNTTAVDNVTFNRFAAGDNPLTGDITPQNYLTYNCSNSPAGETLKEIEFPITPHVKNLESTILTVTFWAMSSLSNSVSVYFNQYFGDGGSPSPTASLLVGTVPLTSTWTRFSIPFTTPTTEGMTLGLCGDDYSYLSFGLQMGVPNNTNLTNVSLRTGSFLGAPAYLYQTEQEVMAQLNTPRTGSIYTGFSPPNPSVYIPFTNGTIGNVGSGATLYAHQRAFPLFYYLYSNINNAQAPVSGGRIDPFSDFAAGKTLALPTDGVSRVFSNSFGSTNGLNFGATTATATGTLTNNNIPPSPRGYQFPTAVNINYTAGGTSNAFGFLGFSTQPTTNGAEYGLAGAPYATNPFTLYQPTCAAFMYLKL